MLTLELFDLVRHLRLVKMRDEEMRDEVFN